jgi:glycerophosphoryl diester phosphodiesterase
MTLVIAHRGASAAHPPGNTVEAFRTARAMGADWVELDARPTVDGALVVHHDAHLPDGRLVADLTVDELPGWVPTLATALDACEGMGVNVEIKVDEPVTGSPRQAEMVDAVVEVLVGAGSPTSRFLVTSFDWSVPARVVTPPSTHGTVWSPPSWSLGLTAPGWRCTCGRWTTRTGSGSWWRWRPTGSSPTSPMWPGR